MKIATWNINSIRLRIDLVAKLNSEHEPDIILLQETKVENNLFPEELCKQIGYEYLHYDGEKSYNGVAILSKIPFDNKFILNIHGASKRHVAVNIQGIEIHNFYIPAGGDIPDARLNPKFKEKLTYLDELDKWFTRNRYNFENLILAGDLNIAPHEHDVWSSRQLRNEVSHTDIERDLMKKIISNFGWHDVARAFVPESEKLYSWWSYRNKNWEKSNRGRRLDHIWVSPSLKEKCKSFYVIKAARNWERPSDHVPVITEIVN